MGRGRDGGGVTERETEESQYFFEPYLWQWQFHRGNITTACALYLASSMGRNRSMFERTRKMYDIFICYAALLNAFIFLRLCSTLHGLRFLSNKNYIYVSINCVSGGVKM